MEGDVCEGNEVGYRIREREKVLGGLMDIWKRGKLTREVKKKMFKGWERGVAVECEKRKKD